MVYIQAHMVNTMYTVCVYSKREGRMFTTLCEQCSCVIVMTKTKGTVTEDHESSKVCVFVCA